MNSPELLVHIERCRRAGYFARDFKRWKMDDVEMMQAAIREGLFSERPDFGQHAGDCCFGLGMEPGLVSSQDNVHAEVVHISALSEIVATIIRKSKEAPWRAPDPMKLGDGPAWVSGAFLDPSGTRLRRVVLASAWSEDRHYHEARAWSSLGEVCAYGLPMQQAVVVLGPRRDGKRHGYFSKAVRHPVSKQLRFRKRSTFGGGFKETWTPIWREDYDEISTQQWIETMMEDGVLQDSCFVVTVEVPEKSQRTKIRDLAAKRLEQLYNTKEAPDQSLSVCDWPTPCVFRGPCHKNEEPSGRYGFVQVGLLDEARNEKTSNYSATLRTLHRKHVP